MRATTAVVSTGIAIFWLASAAPSAARKVRDVELRWAPTSPLTELGWIDLSGVGRRTIELVELDDERDATDRIGEIRDDEPAVYPVGAAVAVAPWVTRGFRDVVGRIGLRRVDSGGDLVVRGALRHLLVTERYGLQAEVALWIVVRDGGEEPVWEGLVLGSASGPSRFDRDRAYSEVLSDAVIAAIVRLFQNSEFTDALGGVEPEEW